MYADDTLTPKEAIRLCALGTLAVRPMSYSELANSTRHFVGRVMGPSLDVLGTSMELLKYEGLIEARIDGGGDDPLIAITDAGRKELHTLLTANIRAGTLELNKLIVALKFRFLHLLDAADQRIQADLLTEMWDNELARLEDLRGHHAGDGGYLTHWLDHDISLIESRLAWLAEFSKANLDKRWRVHGSPGWGIMAHKPAGAVTTPPKIENEPKYEPVKSINFMINGKPSTGLVVNGKSYPATAALELSGWVAKYDKTTHTTKLDYEGN